MVVADTYQGGDGRRPVAATATATIERRATCASCDALALAAAAEAASPLATLPATAALVAPTEAANSLHYSFRLSRARQLICIHSAVHRNKGVL
jgi:hypothetical protein